MSGVAIQHWLKAMHDRPERHEPSHWLSRTMINDGHFIRDGEPKNRPSYRVGDLVAIYLSGTHRCPAAFRVVATAAFDPQRVDREAKQGDGLRWGWVTEVEPINATPLHLAPTIEEVGVLGTSLTRRSRLRISADVYHAIESRL